MQSSVLGQIAEIVGVGCAEMCDGRSQVGCRLSFGLKTRCKPIKQIGHVMRDDQALDLRANSALSVVKLLTIQREKGQPGDQSRTLVSINEGVRLPESVHSRLAAEAARPA